MKEAYHQHDRFEKVQEIFHGIEIKKRRKREEIRELEGEHLIKLQTIRYNARRLGEDKNGQEMLSQLTQLMSLPQVDHNTCAVLSLRAHLSVPQLSADQLSYAINAFVSARLRPKEFFTASAKKIGRCLDIDPSINLEKVGEALYSLAITGIKSKDIDLMFSKYTSAFKRSLPSLSPRVTELVVDACLTRNLIDPEFIEAIMRQLQVRLKEFPAQTLVNIFYYLVKAGALLLPEHQKKPALFGPHIDSVALGFLHEVKDYFKDEKALINLDEQTLQRLYAGLEMSKRDDKLLLEIQDRVSERLGLQQTVE
eukprot:TRINITY_DN12369_c0_g1_i1.p1 TRINITY_DN12369_c0_g1~~TRINITY_DN12369_c0_g1_i1.p1  ORF type:complete len:350 (+),score=81.66 TRINITY_DN12369_c0_g1_i1:121-1050(+)